MSKRRRMVRFGCLKTLNQVACTASRRNNAQTSRRAGTQPGAAPSSFCLTQVEVAKWRNSSKSQAEVVALDRRSSKCALQPKIRIAYLVATNCQLLVFYLV